jgi:hypothetical protein
MSKWPESAVAVALIVLITAVSVAGIARYEVADFLKIWVALTGLIGIITGTIVTYFFTRTSLDQAERKVVETERKLEDERAFSRKFLVGDRSMHSIDAKSQEGRREDQYKEWPVSDQRRLN